jgi:hypothetical protein
VKFICNEALPGVVSTHFSFHGFGRALAEKFVDDSRVDWCRSDSTAIGRQVGARVAARW